MFYSKSTNGFYTTDLHGANMPADVVEITSGQHSQLLEDQSRGKQITAGEDGNPVAVTPPAPEVTIPRAVTMRQARLALLQAGKLVDVNAAIASMAGAAGEAARIEWEYSQEVHRDRALVKSLAPVLGMTDAQLDSLFIAAAAL
jgi:hypothetical protein